jgi:HSP20 family protein
MADVQHFEHRPFSFERCEVAQKPSLITHHFLKYFSRSFVYLIRYLFFHLKIDNMYYNQSCAAKGNYGGRERLFNRSMERAAVNIYKTANSFEMLVFAPGRIKEHFKLDVKGNELTISYTPPEGFPRPEWIRREYSRGGFVRTFQLNETIDAGNITAKYADGVLEVSLPIIPGKEETKLDITVN